MTRSRPTTTRLRSLSIGPGVPRGAHPVRLVFLLAVPAIDAGNYILLIGSLARLSLDLSRLERLHNARDSVEMFDVLKEVRLPSGRSPKA